MLRLQYERGGGGGIVNSVQLLSYGVNQWLSYLTEMGVEESMQSGVIFTV